jgi:hypothetical protein
MHLNLKHFSVTLQDVYEHFWRLDNEMWHRSFWRTCFPLLQLENFLPLPSVCSEDAESKLPWHSDTSLPHYLHIPTCTNFFFWHFSDKVLSGTLLHHHTMKLLILFSLLFRCSVLSTHMPQLPAISHLHVAIMFHSQKHIVIIFLKS